MSRPDCLSTATPLISAPAFSPRTPPSAPCSDDSKPPPEPGAAPAAITSYFWASASAPGIWAKKDEMVVPSASCSSTDKMVPTTFSVVG